MNWFGSLPGFTRTPAGLERVILRRMPRWVAHSTLVLASPSLLARLWTWDGLASDIHSRITAIDIGVVSLVVLYWTVALTVAIGAFIVMVMKGPAYVADAYPLPAPPPDGTSPREP